MEKTLRHSAGLSYPAAREILAVLWQLVQAVITRSLPGPSGNGAGALPLWADADSEKESTKKAAKAEIVLRLSIFMEVTPRLNYAGPLNAVGHDVDAKSSHR